MSWQQRHRHQAPDYGFPHVALPCKGHGFDDVLAPAAPFDASLFNADGMNGLLTNRDVIAADGLLDHSIYTYDVLSLSDGSVSV